MRWIDTSEVILHVSFHISDNLNRIQYTIMLSNGKCCKYLSLLRTKMVWHELSTYTKTNFPTGIKSQILTIYYTYNIAATKWHKLSKIEFCHTIYKYTPTANNDTEFSYKQRAWCMDEIPSVYYVTHQTKLNEITI